MNVFLQLTSAGTNTGPFSLYSNIDGYTVPFQTNISRNQLLLGFMSTLVPTSTTIVRIQSTGDCVQYVDINVEPKTSTTTTTSSSTTTTTTTTIPLIDCVKYGGLYNQFAITDSRGIVADGWRVSSSDDWRDMVIYLDPLYTGFNLLTNVAGNAIKEVGEVYWQSNPNATNIALFNARGAGLRGATGQFASILQSASWWTPEEYLLDNTKGYSTELYYSFQGISCGLLTSKKTEGRSIRPVKNITTLTNGQEGTYIGNDGKVYRTICIDTQEWVADNLNETKYKNGEWIHGFDGGVYTSISNGDWAILETEAMCYHNDDETNGGNIGPCGTTTTTTTTLPSTTTTTTTGVVIPLQILLVARALSGDLNVNAIELCGELYNSIVVDSDSVQVVYFLSNNPIPTVGDFLFIDEACTIPFVSPDGIWWGAITEWDVDITNIYDYTIRIAATGEVLSVQACIDVTTTTTTAAPIRHMEMCVNSTTYDIPNGVNIPYSLSPTVINTPTKAGYNYFFLSIPIDKDFTLLDSLSTNVRSMMSIDLASGIAGVDIRPGYVNNYIYKSSSVFATSLSTEYTITLI